MMLIFVLLVFALYELWTSEGLAQWVLAGVRFAAVIALGVYLFGKGSLVYSSTTLALAIVMILGMWALRSEVQSRDS